MPSYSSFLLSIAAAYLLFGTIQTVSLKWSDLLSASDRFSPVASAADPQLSTSVIYSFAHPFTQTLFMFFGEFVSLVVFAAVLLVRRRRGALVAGRDYSLPCNPAVWLFSCGADLLATLIQNVGMMLTHASLYQMLRGATVVWTAVISYFWLKRRFNKVEMWGMGFVILGLSFVGLSSFASRSGTGAAAGNENLNQQLLGNLLVISAQVLHAYQGVCQERLVRLYNIPPLQMIGMEGLYGLGLTLTLLAACLLFPFVSWGHNVRWVQTLDAGTGETARYTNVTWIAEQLTGSVPYDDVVLAFDQLSSSAACVTCIVIYIFAGFLYNTLQMTIIKNVSAAATVMLGSLRNVTVWTTCLFIPSVFHEHFNVVQFIGFLFLVLGNVLFQRIWITRFDEVLPASVTNAAPLLFVDRDKK